MPNSSAISLEAIAPLAGYKNKIINGDFGIWQRGDSFVVSAEIGTSATADNKYTSDRWQVYSNIPSTSGNITYAVTKNTFPIGTTSKVNEPTYNIAVLTSGASPSGAPLSVVSGIRQYIENVRSTGPGKVTVSFWGNGSGAGSTGSININLVQNLGTAGSPSANITYTNKVDISVGSWLKYETTFNLSNLLGKTLGTNPQGYTRLEFELQNDTTLGTAKLTSISLANVQVENDNNATDFEFRGPAFEWHLCQRYYQEIQAEWVGRFALANWAWPAVVNFPTPMRQIPLVVDARDITNGTTLQGGTGPRGIRGFPVGATTDVVGFNGNHVEINRIGNVNVHIDPGYWNTVYAFDADYQTTDG